LSLRISCTYLAVTLLASHKSCIVWYLPGAVAAMVGEGVAEGTGQATFGKFMGALSGAAIDIAQGRDGTKGLAVGTFTATTAVEENYERHKTCEVPPPYSQEEEPPLTPRSKARKLAEDRHEKRWGSMAGFMHGDELAQHAYDQVETEIAMTATFKERRGETLTDYETAVLHDYRLKHGVILGIAVAAPLAERVVGAAFSPILKGFQTAKRIMGRGSVAKTFQSKFWNRHETHTFLGQTNKVYKRDDLIDLTRVDGRGKTNLELMKNGKPPIGSDGKPINLHHMTQTQSGPIAEVTTDMHTKYHRVLHMWTNQSRGGVTRAEVLPEIDRAAFDKWRAEYWKTRAVELGGGK
jgi:A nuclease of the HNH/ENDO VII superfamily with conserved LHH